MWTANPQHAHAWLVERKSNTLCCTTSRPWKACNLTCQGHLMTDVHVILVSPKSPANIGSVARAAENFEVSRLCVVDPRCDPHEGEAYKLACGSSLMNHLKIVPSLEEAISASAASIGFTRRAGNTRLVHASLHHLLQSFPHLLPSRAISQIGNSVDQDTASSGTKDSNDLMSDLETSSSIDAKTGTSSSTSSSTSSRSSSDSGSSIGSSSSSSSSDSGSSSSSKLISSSRSADRKSGRGSNSSKSADRQGTTTALVFGREESGLTEAELSLCTHSCSIPAGSIQPSLNLSHAVCVILAQIFQHRSLGNTGLPTRALPTTRKHHQPASNADISVLLQRWTDLAAAAGVGSKKSVGGTGSHGRKRRTAGHIEAVLSRAQVTQQELRALHGLCSALLTKVDQDSH